MRTYPRLDADDHDFLPDRGSRTTSSIRNGFASEVTAYAGYAADHISSFPLAAWQVRFEQDAPVREINHPADWHTLCLEFPYRAPDGRLIPNWREVSDNWDGVRLTLGGVLSGEQARYEANSERSMMQFCHCEQTRWLKRLRITGERLPDFQQSEHELNQEPLDISRFPYGYGFKPGP